MKIIVFSHIFLLFFIASIGFTKPTGESISIGKRTAGCIKNSAILPVDGFGYQVIRTSRKSNYGHKQLIILIENLASKAKSTHNVTLLVADISKKNGGPMPKYHDSHQNGLDVDILYIHKNKSKNQRYSTKEREKISPRSVINTTQTTVDPNKWDLVNGEILKLASFHHNVDRIFVNPLIKKELCLKYHNEKWLKKIRPWWKHDKHFHLRLKCPVNSIKCDPSPKIPKGTGCGSDLEWWFSKKAHKKGIKRITNSKKKKVMLPKECDEI